MDFIPDYQSRRVTVLVKNGTYEEIVYFRNKTNVTILGENRDKVIVKYQNQESFNPHPANFSTNELPGTFPSRRAAFAVDHSDGIHLVNLTIMNTTPFAQAEGLLLNGRENFIYNCTVRGSGDALQSNGSAYYEKCLIEGSGDMILGRGPAFFKDCELRSPGPYMWIRNTSAKPRECVLILPVQHHRQQCRRFSPSPVNGSRTYPYCEAVLIQCQLEGISPAGWGTIGGDATNVHFWEYNSTNTRDGKPLM
jgi:hypothetical protein